MTEAELKKNGREIGPLEFGNLLFEGMIENPTVINFCVYSRVKTQFGDYKKDELVYTLL